jgi:nicotinamidase-related amidase
MDNQKVEIKINTEQKNSAEQKISTEQKINTEKTALVVIDLQNGVVNSERYPYTGSQVVEKSKKLINECQKKGIFVVFVRVSSTDGKDILNPITDSLTKTMHLPAGWDAFVPELEEFKDAYRLSKRNMGAFYGTDLDLQLRRRKIDTIILCGISTGIGVDTTAREAYQHNYNQIFIEDAMTASTKEEHEYVCNYIFPRLGRIRTVEEVLKLLEDSTSNR